MATFLPPRLVAITSQTGRVDDWHIVLLGEPNQTREQLIRRATAVIIGEWPTPNAKDPDARRRTDLEMYSLTTKPVDAITPAELDRFLASLLFEVEHHKTWPETTAHRDGSTRPPFQRVVSTYEPRHDGSQYSGFAGPLRTQEEDEDHAAGEDRAIDAQASAEETAWLESREPGQAF